MLPNVSFVFGTLKLSRLNVVNPVFVCAGRKRAPVWNLDRILIIRCSTKLRRTDGKPNVLADADQLILKAVVDVLKMSDVVKFWKLSVQILTKLLGLIGFVKSNGD